MKKLYVLLISLCLIGYVTCFAWESTTYDQATSVDLIALEHGYYVSASTVTGSVCSVPMYGNFTNRRNITLYNKNDDYNAYIINDPTEPYTNGFPIPPGYALSLDMGPDATNCTILMIASESTIEVTINTIEIR